jgi:hypothetical protein
VPGEVDDDGSDDFANFDDDEDALDPADEQRALIALFETTRRDRAVLQFMAAECRAHEKVRDIWQRNHQPASEDMYLIARVTMGAEHVRHRMEARKAAAFHETAAARAEAGALADAATEAARARVAQAQVEAEEAAWRAHWANAMVEGQVRRAAEELHS